MKKPPNKLYLENQFGLQAIQEDTVTRLMDWTLERYQAQQPWQITVVLVDDPTLTAMHKQYLDDDTPTDVMTFDLTEPKEEFAEGEIYISVERAQENSKELNVTLTSEVYRLIAHGLLHLMGKKDKTDPERAAMRMAEDEILENFDLL